MPSTFANGLLRLFFFFFFFLLLRKVILLCLGQPGKVLLVSGFAHWQRFEECSEWEQEWNERKERVCAGAEREVASSRAPAGSLGSRQAGRQQAAGGGEGTQHPGKWRLHGHRQTPISQLCRGYGGIERRARESISTPWHDLSQKINKKNTWLKIIRSLF